MGFNLHIPLPGPFSYNARLTGGRRRPAAKPAPVDYNVSAAELNTRAARLNEIHAYLVNAVNVGINPADAARWADGDAREVAEDMIKSVGGDRWAEIFTGITLGQIIDILRAPKRATASVLDERGF